MANKVVLVGTGILVVGAATVLLLKPASGSKDGRLGQTLLGGSTGGDASSVDKIAVKKGSVTTIVQRDNVGVWHLDSTAGYPADAGQVARLVDELSRAKVQMVAGSGDAVMKEMGLNDSQELVLSAGGKDVAALRLGDNRRGGGQYVAFGTEAKAYLIPLPIAVPSSADAWERTTLLQVPKAELKSLSFHPDSASGKKPALLAREKPEEPLKLKDLPAGRSEGSEVASQDSLAAQVSYTKRYPHGSDEAKDALAVPSTVEVTLFNGTSYLVSVGSHGDKSKKWFVQIHGDAHGGKSDAVDAVNAVMASGAFEVPEYTAQRFVKGIEDFLRPEGKG